MDGPPAVTVEVPAHRTDAAIAAALNGVFTACIVALVFGGSIRFAEQWLGVAALLALSLLPAWQLVRISCRRSGARLRWDGEGWSWSCAGHDAACSVRWTMDLQHWMLLQLRQEDGHQEWVWLRRKALAKNWFALRRALIFSAGAAHDSTKSGPVESGL